MTRWHKRLRNKLGHSLHALRGFRGHIDGVMDNALVGWVAPADPAHHPLTVGLFTSQGLLLQEIANIHRGDLEAAGIGNGRCGFALPLSPVTRAAIDKCGGQVTVRVIGPSNFLVGSHNFPREGGETPTGSNQSDLAKALFGDVTELDALLEQVETAPPPSDAPRLARHSVMFADTDYVNGTALPEPLAAYQDYVRYRNRYNEDFDLSDPDEARHFLKFYIDFFGSARGGLRIPLSKAQLDRLNAPIRLDGHRFEISHITWSHLVDYPQLRGSMDLSNPDWCFALSYWWSIHKSKSLHCEDCLVPDQYVAQLSAVPKRWQGKNFPLSRFMEQFVAENAFLHQFDQNEEQGREQITMALMIRAIQRPDFLRYLPQASVETLLAEDSTSGQTRLSRLAEKTFGDSLRVFCREAYAAALRLRGFDLKRRCFLSFTPEGHRVEAAQLPPATTGETVDVQMIGPFRKASGLGQATRLSASVMDLTPHSVNAVNFGLDNPAPEGFSSERDLSDYKPARINLIHLNAESIPLAYAYQPDVFTDAYNIGYFFWELDTPAACHYLGLDLLDEIWVSTDYGVSIYQPEVDIPVTNVGMCFEELPEIRRQDARAFVCERLGYSGDEFVFFVAFDSFSFVQRKNPVGTVKAFKDTFEGNEDVRLVIKTQNRRKVGDPVQIAIWEQVDELIKGDRRITLMDETLKYNDLLRLKKGCDCYISLHKSEGWGFGMIEAMNLKVPVVATAYSGNMDFCSPETAWLVDYHEVELRQGDYIFVRPGQKWAEPDHDDAVRQLRGVYENGAEREARAEAAWQNVQENFSEKAIARRYMDRLGEITKGLEKG